MSAWDEHDNRGGAVGNDQDLLEPALDDAVTDVEQSAHNVEKKKRGGINPRLLAVLMMVLVISGAGFFLLKAKRGAVLDAPLEPAANMASTDPVAQQPPPVGMPLSVAPSGGGDMLAMNNAGAPAQPGMPSQPPSFVPDSVQLPAGASQPVVNTAPAGQVPSFTPAAQGPAAVNTPPVTAPQSQQPAQAVQRNAANDAQVRALAEERDRLAEKNRLLEERVRKLEAAPAASGVKSAAKSAPRHASKSETSKGVKKGRDDEIVTESRDTKLASMSVRAVYPLSGRNARAWVNVGTDLVEVSAGSSIDGIKVRSINPESLEVVTDAGVIRAAR